MNFRFQSTAFFPIDGQGFGNSYSVEGIPRNFGFTLSIHQSFTYLGEETLFVEAADDTWVFINDMLAVDLGGVHSFESAMVDLTYPGKLKLPIFKSVTIIGSCVGNFSSAPCATNSYSHANCSCILGLDIGNSYSFDLFYAQRHTNYSVLNFTTNLILLCPWYDWCNVCQGKFLHHITNLIR